ncbi:hypothetical protein [Microbulbifer variabilis]|uniref:hypothetical protein n=1 Tax=Microbulbifer variabilis TaxID=266805 RepID=UPI001CFE83C8|nr:hypothetical protein [Microbulbifer variabilis]
MTSVSGASSQGPKSITRRENKSQVQEKNPEETISKKRTGLRAILFSKLGVPNSVKSIFRRPNEVKPTNSEGNRTIWSGSDNVGSPSFLAEFSRKGNDGNVSRESCDLFEQPFAEAVPDHDDPNNIQIYKDLDFDEILNINGHVSPKVPEKVSYRNIPPLKPHMFGKQRNAGNDLGLLPLPPKPPIDDTFGDILNVDSFSDKPPNMTTEEANENNNEGNNDFDMPPLPPRPRKTENTLLSLDDLPPISNDNLPSGLNDDSLSF